MKDQDLVNIPFFKSLHRPLHQPLKMARLVCSFISKENGIRSSELNINFYFFLIRKLHIEYSKVNISEYNGLPSKEAIFEIHNYFAKKSIKERKKNILEILQSNRSQKIETQIYSTYKAASYFVNLAKDKLLLIDKNNELTESGNELLLLRSKKGLVNLSEKEKEFFCKLLIKFDFLQIISTCFVKKTTRKFQLREYDVLYWFLDKYYNIKQYNTIESLRNYHTVRSHWIDIIGILDKRFNLKKQYIDYICNDKKLSNWYKVIIENYEEFELTYFKKQQHFLNKTEKFEELYEKCILEGRTDIGFVNLYDIKDNIKMSYNSFQEFLNEYYETEKKKKHIFFNNIDGIIDRRKRFRIKNTPVLKIKIKK